MASGCGRAAEVARMAAHRDADGRARWTRPVGAGLRLTELGLGGSMLGNLYRATTDAQGRGAVDAAWDGGVRYFDTAPHYGLGLAERRLGEFLADRPRADYVISTKVGRLLVDDPTGAVRRDDQGFDVPATARRVWDFSADGVLRSIESSLERLGTDRIDVALLHDPDDRWEQAVSQGYPALARLRDEGVVAAIGAGMNQSAMLSRFVRETDMDVVMVASRYTLLEQGALADLLPAAEERGTAVIAAGVFNTGLLARPQPEPGAKYEYGEAPPELVHRAQRMAAVCERHGAALPAAAIQFPFGHPAVVSVVLGAADSAEMRANTAAHAATVPSAVWEDLRGEGLIPDDVPLPDHGGLADSGGPSV
jgi:D-threo-aldose 1-dehydrogenase